ACGRADYRAANAFFEESLALYRELGSRISISRSLDALANLAILKGQSERAARLSALADRLRESIHSVRSPSEQSLYQRNVAAIRGELNEDALSSVAAQTQALPWDQAIVHALGSIPA